MKVLLLQFVFLLGLTQVTIGQERYLDEVFNEVNKETYPYSKGLKLDVYSPVNDKQAQRPLLLLVHGGGFSGGQRDGDLESGFMNAMAKKGYVAASMSYRLLRKDKGFGCDCPSSDKKATFLEAAKDVYAASEYLKTNANFLGIDPEKIVLVGSSAGAEAVLNAAFMRESPAYKAVLEKPIKYAGLISFAGAVLDASLITAENAIPSLFFHGKKDKLVPYGTAPHHYCSKKDPGFIVLDGSRTMARKIRKQQLPVLLAKDPKGGHNWASIPFQKSALIAHFIYEAVLQKSPYRKRIRLSAKQ